jgi:hypothetical protein
MNTKRFANPKKVGSALLVASVFHARRRIDVLETIAGDFIVREKTGPDTARLIGITPNLRSAEFLATKEVKS